MTGYGQKLRLHCRKTPSERPKTLWRNVGLRCSVPDPAGYRDFPEFDVARAGEGSIEGPGALLGPNSVENGLHALEAMCQSTPEGSHT